MNKFSPKVKRGSIMKLKIGLMVWILSNFCKITQQQKQRKHSHEAAASSLNLNLRRSLASQWLWKFDKYEENNGFKELGSTPLV